MIAIKPNSNGQSIIRKPARWTVSGSFVQLSCDLSSCNKNACVDCHLKAACSITPGGPMLEIVKRCVDRYLADSDFEHSRESAVFSLSYFAMPHFGFL